jgi:hypothetical protein
VFVCQLSIYTEEWLAMKDEFLQNMIPIYASASAVGGAVPLPGVGIAIGTSVDATIVTAFVIQAKNHFGITAEILQQRGLDSRAIIAFIGTRVAATIGTIGLSIAAEEAANSISLVTAAPTLGISLALASVFNASVSFVAMYAGLTMLLSDIREAVRKLMAGEEILV